MQLQTLLAVASGGCLGAVLRHITCIVFKSAHFPWSILSINVLGSLVLGVLTELLALRWQLSMPARVFWVTGFLGSYTTFSAFSLETILMIERGDWSMAIGYAFGSVVLVILGIGLGLWGTRYLLASV